MRGNFREVRKNAVSYIDDIMYKYARVAVQNGYCPATIAEKDIVFGKISALWNVEAITDKEYDMLSEVMYHILRDCLEQEVQNENEV